MFDARIAVLRRAALQALAGGLVWMASPGLGDWLWLAGAALVPFVLSLRHTRGIGAALWGALGGAWYIVPGKWSTFASAIAAMGEPQWVQWLYLLGFFALFCLPFAIFAVVWQAVRQHHHRWAVLWAGGFGFAALIVYCPVLFPYTPVAMISSAPVLIQLADIGGEPLLLGLLLTMTLGASRLVVGRSVAWRGPLAALLLPPILALSYAAAVMPQWQAPAEGSVSVLAFQSQWPRLSSDQLLLRDSASGRPKSAVELTRAGLLAAPHCQMVVWPESARAPSLPDRACARAQRLAGDVGKPILASCLSGDARGHSMSADLYALGGRAGQHRKSRLVPFYETTGKPGTDALWPGQGPDVLSAAGIPPFAPAICYEVHFRHDLRAAVHGGAQFFAHMANFATFQHIEISHWDLAMTRLRAVETRRSIVRSVNAGLAGMVAPTGRWTPAGAASEASVNCHTAPLSTRITVYARWGDAVFGLIALLLFGLAIRPSWAKG